MKFVNVLPVSRLKNEQNAVVLIRMLMLIRILQQIGTTTDLIPIGLQETVFNGITN